MKNLIRIILFGITRFIYRIIYYEEFDVTIILLVSIFMSSLLMVALLDKFSVKTIIKKILTINLGYK